MVKSILIVLDDKDYLTAIKKKKEFTWKDVLMLGLSAIEETTKK